MNELASILTFTARLIALLLLTIVVGFGPGWFFVRRFAWTPLEALAASVGLSLTMLFVAAFGAFWLEAPAWVGVGISVAAAVLTVVSWPDARRLWRHAIVRRALLALAGLTAWTFLLLTIIRQYGGGDSCCDWLEHYQRTRNFLEPWPLDFLYIGRYLLPARPPLMNVVAADLLGQVGFQFPLYQVLFSVLNLLVFLPCCQISRLLALNGRPADPRIVAVLLGANPVFFVNTTFAWTKGLTAFFVLFALALYVAGLRKGDRRRIGAAFLALAAATVTHYSAAPCAILVGLHYLAGARPFRARRLGEVALVVSPAVLLVALWAGYSVRTFGLDDGLLRNPSLQGTEDTSARASLGTRVLNLRDTFIPHPYAGYRGYPPNATTTRWTADSIFTLYQGNAILSMGCVNGVMAIVLAVSTLRRKGPVQERRFWGVFVGFLWVVGVLVHGDRSESGLAMIALQPVTYLALAFLATRLRELPIWAKRLWFGGALVDLALGIALAVWFETGSGEWSRTPNWAIKADAEVRFLGDYISTPAVPVVLLLACAIGAARFMSREVLRAPRPMSGASAPLLRSDGRSPRSRE